MFWGLCLSLSPLNLVLPSPWCVVCVAIALSNELYKAAVCSSREQKASGPGLARRAPVPPSLSFWRYEGDAAVQSALAGRKFELTLGLRLESGFGLHFDSASTLTVREAIDGA